MMRGLRFNQPMEHGGDTRVLASYHNPRSITWRWALYWTPKRGLGWRCRRLWKSPAGSEWQMFSPWGELRWSRQPSLFREPEER